MPTVPRRLARRSIDSLPLLLLLALAAWSFEGPARFFQSSGTDLHRVVAAQLWRGKYELPQPVTGGFPQYDLELFGGAFYTHWGYGVPLLRLPWLALPSFALPAPGPRGIFLVWFVLLLVFLYSALRRSDGPIVGGALTAWILAVAVWWAARLRFTIYEENIAYFALAELAALAAWWRGEAAPALRTRWNVACGIFASLATLIRPVGMGYVGLWAVAIALRPTERRGRAVATFALAAAPGIAFWLWTNHVRTGDAFSLGFQNSCPYSPVHYLPLRFGSACVGDASGVARVAFALARYLFWGGGRLSASLDACRFGMELPQFAPYLGLAFPFGFLFGLADRRGWLAGLAVLGLFASYVFAGVGFTARYALDFWPLFFFTVLLFWRRARSFRAARVAVALLLLGTFTKALPLLKQPIANDRILEDVVAATPVTVPSERWRAQTPDPIFRERTGWAEDGSVREVTNLVLALPPGAGSDFKMKLRMSDASARGERPRAFVDGRLRPVEWRGSGWEVSFSAARAERKSPYLLVAIGWAPTYGKPAVRLEGVKIDEVKMAESGNVVDAGAAACRPSPREFSCSLR